MSRDLENATKAAQSADLLLADLRELIQSKNLLLSDIALSEAGLVASLAGRLNRLRSNLETMEPKS